MFKVILKVLFWVAVAIYAALFMQWNMSEINVIGLTYQDMAFAVKAPVAYIAFGGVVVGVIIMGIAAASAWAAQRRTALSARSKVNAAKKRLQQRNKKINELQEQVKDLQTQLETMESELELARTEAEQRRGAVIPESEDVEDIVAEGDDQTE